MKTISKELNIETRGEGDIIDLTGKITETLGKTGLQNGLLTAFIPGSTAAVTTIEYEPGLRKDFPLMLERLIPRSLPYEHDKTWRDGNGHSHVRASIIGPSLTIPFVNGALTLGTWQQVVLVEMDVQKHSRRLIIQMIGE